MKVPFILAVPQANALILHCQTARIPVLYLGLAPVAACEGVDCILHNSRGAVPLKVITDLCSHHNSFLADDSKVS